MLFLEGLPNMSEDQVLEKDRPRASAAKPALEIQGSRLFADWLASTGGSLILTTYQAGKVFMIGTRPNGQLSICERSFSRSMGIGVGNGAFWVSTLYQMWRFENYLDAGQGRNDHDAMFVPVCGHTTGDIDIHDVHLDAQGAPIFVATRFNTIAKLSDKGSFRPVWQPPFIDRLAAEDRCHLNGLAAANGEPIVASCIGESNIADGWRDKRQNGGLLIHVPTNEVLARGLSMPHSPRLYEGELFLLQAGTGEFGVVNEDTGGFEPLCFLPGFARGLTFSGHHAIVGLSRPRDTKAFNGLALNDRLDREGVSPRTAVCVVNIDTGDLEHQLSFEGVISELYDVQFLPGVRCPTLLGFKSDDIRFAVRPDV